MEGNGLSRFLLDEHMVTESRPCKHSLTYCYRWIEGVPLRNGKDALAVNWIGVSTTDAKGKAIYDGVFVTGLPLPTDTVEAAKRGRLVKNTRISSLSAFQYSMRRSRVGSSPSLFMAGRETIWSLSTLPFSGTAHTSTVV